MCGPTVAETAPDCHQRRTTTESRSATAAPARRWAVVEVVATSTSAPSPTEAPSPRPGSARHGQDADCGSNQPGFTRAGPVGGSGGEHVDHAARTQQPGRLGVGDPHRCSDQTGPEPLQRAGPQEADVREQLAPAYGRDKRRTACDRRRAQRPVRDGSGVDPGDAQIARLQPCPGGQVTGRGHDRRGRGCRGSQRLQREGHRTGQQPRGEQPAVPAGRTRDVPQPPPDRVAFASGTHDSARLTAARTAASARRASAGTSSPRPPPAAGRPHRRGGHGPR